MKYAKGNAIAGIAGAMMLLASSASAQSDASNAVCTPGNYQYDHKKEKTKEKPCDDEKVKCMLHAPCESGFVRGTCEAEGRCRALSVKICDANTGICDWTKPQQPTLPTGSAPTEPGTEPRPGQPLPEGGGITDAFKTIEEIDTENQARAQLAQQRLQEAFDKWQSDPANQVAHMREIQNAQQELRDAMAALGQGLDTQSPSSPESFSVRAYLRRIGENLTPWDQLPAGDAMPMPERPSVWFNGIASTFEPYRVAELAEGPPVALLSGSELERERELRRLTLQAEAELRLGYFAPGEGPGGVSRFAFLPEGVLLGTTPPETPFTVTQYSFDSISEAVSAGVKCLFGSCPEPKLVEYIGGLPPLALLPPSPLSFDPYGSADDWIGDFSDRPYVLSGNLLSDEQLQARTSPFDLQPSVPFGGINSPADLDPYVISGNMQPTLREQIESHIVNGGPTGVIDEKGTLWGFEEQGRPIVKIDSPEGREIAGILGCEGSCYESAVEESLRAISDPRLAEWTGERAYTEKELLELERELKLAEKTARPAEPAPKTEPKLEPAPKTGPKMPTPKTGPVVTTPGPKIPPSSPSPSESPSTGGGSGGSLLSSLQSMLPSILNMLLNLLNYLRGSDPAMPPIQMPMQPMPTPMTPMMPTVPPEEGPKPILSIVASPSIIDRGEEARLSWASANWKNPAETRCVISKLGISVASGNSGGFYETGSLDETTTFKISCTSPGDTPLEKEIRITVR